MKNMEKRKRIMGRSMRLGHCICDPKKACPCDTLREKDVCPCAGERLEVPSGPVRLTDLVERPGCASKIDKQALLEVLQGLPTVDDPRVLVGMPAGDDAGVLKIAHDMALVQTVDVFSPSVDDPHTFGRIAAANSLSDVYAMGGRPVSALSIIGFPIRSVSDDVMHQILRGGIDKMNEAGVPVVGGHSINDQEIKAGFAVTGLIHPDKIFANAGVRPGDRLILTKPLGTGILAFAAQIGRAPEEGLEAVARCMAALNRRAAELMVECGARACTDVTGFGLMGHLTTMAAASKVDVEIVFDDVPLLPGVLQCAADGIFSGAVERNKEASAKNVTTDEAVEPAMLEICFDPQTSGGLLIAAGQSEAEELLGKLHAEGVPEAAVIGRATEAGTGRVFVRGEGRRRMPSPRRKDRTLQTVSAPAAEGGRAETSAPTADACCAQQETKEMSSRESNCCAGGHGSGEDGDHSPGVGAEVQRKFQEFLKAANAPGALDGRTKKAAAIALSVLAKCEPCAKIHIKKAREMGFSQEEIDEAAWLAVAFGGSPTMMFYSGVKRAK